MLGSRFAALTFDLKVKEATSYDTMIRFRAMQLDRALLSLIERCKTSRELKQIHTQLVSSHHLSSHSRFSLTTRFLFRCAIPECGGSSLSYAARVFSSIATPNLYAYNVMIRAYSGSGKSVCWDLYKKMLRDGIKPDCITIPFVLKECGTRGDGRMGRSVHLQAMKFGMIGNVYVSNAVISLYSVFGDLGDARKVFDEMPERDVVSWNSVLIASLRCGDMHEALNLFRSMGSWNIFTWNSIITGFVQGGREKEALELFHEMQRGGSDRDFVKPDKITFANVITACASIGAIDHGKWVHSYLKRSGVECDNVIKTALVNMYGKCGCVDTAVEVFRNMRNKDVLACTAMISVFALHGRWEEALETFEEMVSAGVKPNHVTFVGLLSACAHSGLVDKGRRYFDAMCLVHGLEPQVYHYACMVDMLSRAGLFEEAERLIRSMPMKPDVYVLGALLGGCQMHGNVNLGAEIAQSLIDLDPSNHAFYMNLVDMYTKAGHFEDVKRIRNLMKERGIKKDIAGCSSIELDGIVHEFSIGGSPDVEMDQLFHLLDGL